MRPLSRLQVRLGITALLVALAGPAFPQAPSAGLEKTGDFRVLIDATGKLKSAAPLDANLGDALSRAMIGAAKDIVFQPAMRDGQPASFESQLHLVARFVAVAGGGYKLELVSASLAPQWLTREHPVFPRGLDPRKIDGVVVARASIRADGSVDPGRSAVLQSAVTPGSEASLPALERAALDAILKSRFQPDLVGGEPVAMEVAQSFRFCTEACTQPEPDPSDERKQLPRILDAGTSAARVPAALAARSHGLAGKALRFRITIDAAGKVGSATALGGGDAAALERARQGLLGVQFFPATIHGRAVPSEMPVDVPVLVEDGKVTPQLSNLGLEKWQLSFPTPRIADHTSAGSGEIRARLHFVTTPDGRIDRGASGVESLEILPAGSVTVEREMRKEFMEAMELARFDPVLVDGKGVSFEFWRSYNLPYCVAATRCTPPKSTPLPADPPVKLPEGVELARVKP